MDKIGNLKRERKVFRSRVIFSVVIMLAMTLILTFRLFNLQIIQHEYYVEEALGIKCKIFLLPHKRRYFGSQWKNISNQ